LPALKQLVYFFDILLTRNVAVCFDNPLNKERADLRFSSIVQQVQDAGVAFKSKNGQTAGVALNWQFEQFDQFTADIIVEWNTKR
jgi:hypothetical protein